MHKRLVFLIIGIIMTSAFLNIGIITETLAQEVEDDSLSLSGQSIEEAAGNVTEGSIIEITANKTGVEEDDSLSLSGQSIEEAAGNVTEGSITELTANKTGVEEDDSLSLSGQSIEEAKKEK